MKLDRYDIGVPKFLVFRHIDASNPVTSDNQVRVIRDADGRWYREVDPWECFVLKRRDVTARLMVTFGAMAASILGDAEYGAHLRRLAEEWTKRTEERLDSKMPD